MQKLTDYTSWFGHGSSFPKSDKKDCILSSVPKNANFAGIWWLIAKNCEFYVQSFNSKTDWLFFLFLMVCKTWRWYYGFCCGASFPQIDKKDCTLSSVRNLAVVLLVWPGRVIFQRWQKELYFVISAQNADFAGWLRKNWEFLHLKFQCKNWLAILPLCDGMQNLVLVLPVWLWWCHCPKVTKNN